MLEDDLTEPDTLQDAIRGAVDQWCIRNGGMALALIAAVDLIDPDGVPLLSVTQMPDQLTHRSMGLTAYLTEWYRDDASTEMVTAAYGVWEDDD